MNPVVAFLIYASMTLTAPQPVVQEAVVIPVKESLFLSMERTPCFGKCPHYKIQIFNTGNVVYEGFRFTEKEGKYTKKLKAKELKEIQDMLGTIGFFELSDKYDTHKTDIPSVHLMVIYNGKKKKILDRDGAPKDLKAFEKLIDFLVITDDLKKGYTKDK